MSDVVLTGSPMIAVRRGTSIESLHAVAACAADDAGNVALADGTIDVPVFLRSAAKPFIAAAIVEAGCAERFGLDDAEIAVIAASHNAEPFHVAAVESILRKTGISAAALKCGAHAPSYEPAASELAARGEAPTALHNNCSGKHAGILALAKLLGAPLESYLEPEHPAQQRILALCERVSDDTFTPERIAIDGCGIPVYATSLRLAARSYARLATLEHLDERDAGALRRVRDAMTANPEMVAGTGRFDTAVMDASAGAIVAKAGAEAVQACALREHGIGLVLKVVDGGRRAVNPAACALLERLGALDDHRRDALRNFSRSNIRNVAGRVVGSIAPIESTVVLQP